MNHETQHPFDFRNDQACSAARPFLDRWLGAVLLAVCMLTSNLGQAADTENRLFKGSVGMSIEWKQVVILGSELEVRPLKDDLVPVVLKIDQTWPHGSDFRYDFTFYGLEEGTFDLKDYLQRKDGSPLHLDQPLSVVIESVLPKGTFEPSAVQRTQLPESGGYRNTMTALGAIWIIGLGALIWSMRRRKKNATDACTQAMEPSLAEKLEPLVQEAASGTLNKEQQAQLERLLLSYWNNRLDLQPNRPEDRIRQLKEHDEAGPLLMAIEKWLHSQEQVDDTEIQTLLKPYRSISLEVTKGMDSKVSL